jgi:ribonuclease BN (tRNA processing enzyme)
VSDTDWIKFLGTAGARFVMAKQIRYSAGTCLHLRGTDIMLDPGPGTLTRCATCRPSIDATGIDAVILTHAHIDHSNDVNAMIDAMTKGGIEKRGELFAPRDCLEGENRVVLNYLRDYPERVQVLEPESDYEIHGVKFSTSVALDHSVQTYGIKFHRPPGDLSFLVDTRYFDSLADSYRGADVLVINVVRRRPHEKLDLQHLTIDKAEEVIREVEPRLAVITHFGMTMVKAKPWELAGEMSDRLGIEVIAAGDGKKLELDGDDNA